MFEDRIEVVSPGGLPAVLQKMNICPENFLF